MSSTTTSTAESVKPTEKVENVSLSQSQQKQQQQQQQPKQQYSTGTSFSSSSHPVISIKHNFSEEVENCINDLINVFYFGAYTCRSMQFYFDRDDVAMYGMADFNRCKADQQLEFVRKLEDYQVIRGGRVILTDIKKPERDEWSSPADSLPYMIEMMKLQVQNCLKLHECCERSNDEHLKDFLETELLEPLYEAIRKLGVLLTNVERAGKGLGEYEFNKDLELNLERITSSRKIKHGQSKSVVTSYSSDPSYVDQHFTRLPHPSPHVHHHPHSHPHEHGLSSILNRLNIGSSNELVDVLKAVF